LGWTKSRISQRLSHLQGGHRRKKEETRLVEPSPALAAAWQEIATSEDSWSSRRPAAGDKQSPGFGVGRVSRGVLCLSSSPPAGLVLVVHQRQHHTINAIVSLSIRTRNSNGQSDNDLGELPDGPMPHGVPPSNLAFAEHTTTTTTKCRQQPERPRLLCSESSPINGPSSRPLHKNDPSEPLNPRDRPSNAAHEPVAASSEVAQPQHQAAGLELARPISLPRSRRRLLSSLVPGIADELLLGCAAETLLSVLGTASQRWRDPAVHSLVERTQQRSANCKQRSATH